MVVASVDHNQPEVPDEGRTLGRSDDVDSTVAAMEPNREEAADSSGACPAEIASGADRNVVASDGQDDPNQK